MENTLKFCKANTKQIDEANGIIPFTLTTFTVDRDGDVIFPAGGILTNFRKNPISLFMHNAFDVPPAKLLPDTIRSNTKEMTGDVQFDIVNDPFAKFLFDKYIDGYLSAGSIRFIPIEFDTEIAIEGQTGFGIKVWELIEFSLVTIPSNTQALRKEYDEARQGLYLDYQKPYYSVIEKFSKYKNPNIDIEKQIFPFCIGEGCKDLADTKEKEIEILAIDPKEDEKIMMEIATGIATSIKKDCECEENKSSNGFIDTIFKGFDKSFLVEAQEISPANKELEWASKFCECEVKNLYVTTTGFNDLWKGSFLSELFNKMIDWDLKDSRDLNIDGKEYPPCYETIQLNSKEFISTMISGLEFWNAQKFNIVIKYKLYGYNERLIFYIDKDYSKDLNNLLSTCWNSAKTNHKLKNESFTLSGKFIDKTNLDWDDVFLTDFNTDIVKKAINSINNLTDRAPNRGLIFMGSPGNGKTFTGKVVLNKSKSTFIWITAKDLYWMGSVSGLSYAFDVAKTLAPCILFIEDIDSFISSTLIDLLKTEMDGIEQSSGITTILTTNFPERLPKALIDRPGRFHDVLDFDFPDSKQIIKMLSYWYNGLTKTFIQEIVEDLKGLSGAHIFELVQYSKMIEDEEKKLPEISFMIAYEKTLIQKETIENLKFSNKSETVSERQFLEMLKSHVND